MHVTVKHVGGMGFEGVGKSGEITKIFASASQEYKGTSPMELVLMGIAGCSGIDMISILEKMRISYNRLEIDVDGDRAQEHPRVFTDIRIVYKFWGNDLPEEKLKHAIELSIEKYCSVINMVNKVANVTYIMEINPESV